MHDILLKKLEIKLRQNSKFYENITTFKDINFKSFETFCSLCLAHPIKKAVQISDSSRQCEYRTLRKMNDLFQ